MKIGIMLRSVNDVGGVGEYTRSLLHALLGFDTENQYFLFLRTAAGAEQFDRYPNARKVLLPTKRRFYFDQVLVPRAIREHKCDVVINMKHSLPLLTQAKTILVMHGADWIAFPQNYYFLDRLYHKLSLPIYCSKADKIISVSKDAARIAVEKMGLPAEKLETVYHGFRAEFCRVTDPQRQAAVRERYKLPGRFILFVGRIYPMKNVAGLVEAFALLKDRIPHNLVISGIKYYKNEQALAGIDRHGLVDRVNLTGFVEESDLPVLYSMADAFVMPSLYEGFGIPLLEAMACGCPIITSTAGSCPEVVADAAELVDPTDHAAIARGIEKVLTDAGLAADLREKGLRRVRDFSWQKSARETLEVIRSVAT